MKSTCEFLTLMVPAENILLSIFLAGQKTVQMIQAELANNRGVQAKSAAKSMRKFFLCASFQDIELAHTKMVPETKTLSESTPVCGGP